MKTKKINILLLLALSLFFINSSYSQECDRINWFDCEEDEGDFDYRSMSKVASMSPGDTVSMKIAVYSGQRYRIMLCGDPDLGELDYSVFSSTKKYKTVIKKITPRESIEMIPIKNSQGVEEMDEWGNPLLKERTIMVNDTTFVTEVSIENKTYFDTKKGGMVGLKKGEEQKPYLEREFAKPVTLTIKIVVPPGDPDFVGCVSILIGRKTKRTGTVTVYSPTREG